MDRSQGRHGGSPPTPGWGPTASARLSGQFSFCWGRLVWTLSLRPLNACIVGGTKRFVNWVCKWLSGNDLGRFPRGHQGRPSGWWAVVCASRTTAQIQARTSPRLRTGNSGNRGIQSTQTELDVSKSRFRKTFFLRLHPLGCGFAQIYRPLA